MKYEEAEQMSRRSLEGCEKHLGPWHPTTLDAVHNQAWFSYIRKDYQIALQMSDRVVEGRLRVLGPSHPQTLESQEARSQLLLEMSQSLGTPVTPST